MSKNKLNTYGSFNALKVITRIKLFIQERRKLMNTRTTIICNKCQDPLADASEMKRYGMTNLGLRTAGDGEINGSKSTLLNVSHSEISPNIGSLRGHAYLDHKFLNEESQYLQSVAMSS